MGLYRLMFVFSVGHEIPAQCIPAASQEEEHTPSLTLVALLVYTSRLEDHTQVTEEAGRGEGGRRKEERETHIPGG